MLCICRGGLRVTVNSIHREMDCGDIGLLNAFDVHNMSGGNCDYYVIQLEPTFLNAFGIDLTQWFPVREENKFLKSDHPLAARMRPLFDRVFEGGPEPEPRRNGKDPAPQKKWTGFVEPDTVPGRIAVVSHLTELLSLVMRYTQEHRPAADSPPKSQNNVRRLKDILQYVENNYKSRITIRSVAGHVYLTENYFCRFFKQATGNTFYEYLNLFRCIKAEELMKDRDKLISDIGFDAGFRNAAYFNKVYKSLRGVTPAKNRRIIYSQDRA
jgi:AraC-like DNA-binding protein